ncbi:MAG: LytTR family DNA-binding domain-containing protein [Lachnospiraceae bacterium]|nr:LytTR family DNA-binding domain-containing protein [Lachnospiraceae bacterium]
MIKIAICDDDKRVVARLEDRLEEIGKENLLMVSIDAFYNGESLEANYRLGERYDIVYLDIEMGMMDGITAAKMVREIDKYAIIIYISNHEEYLIQLFEVEPFRFLKKPIDFKLFDAYFMEAYKRILEPGAYFRYNFKKNSVKILYSNIVYFESDGRSIKIQQKDGNVDKFNGKLNVVEDIVGDSNTPFLRIHQSYLVNFHYIKKICFSKIELYDGEMLCISEERQKTIRERYSQILKGF